MAVNGAALLMNEKVCSSSLSWHGYNCFCSIDFAASMKQKINLFNCSICLYSNGMVCCSSSLAALLVLINQSYSVPYTTHTLHICWDNCIDLLIVSNQSFHYFRFISFQVKILEMCAVNANFINKDFSVDSIKSSDNNFVSELSLSAFIFKSITNFL